MRINPLNEVLNRDPDKILEVSKEEFFTYFFKLLWLTDDPLPENEVKVLAAISAGKDPLTTGISKSNIPTLLKKLTKKDFIIDNDLSETLKAYQKEFVGNVEIVLNFKIKENDIG